jgi:hypothetical protein
MGREREMRRAVLLLLALVGAMLLACTGVVLAQQAEDRMTSGSEEEQSTASDENAPPKTPEKPIPDTYIVVLKEGADPDRVAKSLRPALIKWSSSTISSLGGRPWWSIAHAPFGPSYPSKAGSELRSLWPISGERHKWVT